MISFFDTTTPLVSSDPISEAISEVIGVVIGQAMIGESISDEVIGQSIDYTANALSDTLWCQAIQSMSRSVRRLVWQSVRR